METAGVEPASSKFSPNASTCLSSHLILVLWSSVWQDLLSLNRTILTSNYPTTSEASLLRGVHPPTTGESAVNACRYLSDKWERHGNIHRNDILTSA